MEVLPIFRSHFSKGSSILTLNDPDDDKKNPKDGCDSIFSILKAEGVNRLILVEKTMTGLIDAQTQCEKNNIHLIFGVILNIDDYQDDKNEKYSSHKIYAMAKNSQGIRDLRKVFSLHEKHGCLTSQALFESWTDNLKMIIPYYDSFLYFNNLFFSSFTFDTTVYKDVVFLIEENNMPYDFILQPKVKEYCRVFGYKWYLAKTICYKNRSDIRAFQTHKISCNRTPGKDSSLTEPNLNDFCSMEFCWESYKEVVNGA